MKKTGNVFILGDSYSTFEGYIPEGYCIYYRPDGSDQGNEITKVEETWWYQLLEETEGNLILNSSFSGSTICNTGYNGNLVPKTSFTGRFDKLVESGFFKENKIDTFFLFGGTNDSWADSPIGKLMFSDWNEDDLYFVLPAIGYLLNRIKENVSNAEVYFIINTELKAEIVEGIKTACKNYDIPVIELQNIDKFNGHPGILGMKQIKEQVYNGIK